MNDKLPTFGIGITLIVFCFVFFYWGPMKTLEQDPWYQRIEVPKSLIDEGARVYQRLKLDSQEVYHQLYGSLSNDPQVTLWLPEELWAGLGEKDRRLLGYFIKSRVEGYHRNPGPFTGIVSHAPAYKMAVENCRKKMSPDSWSIWVLEKSREGQYLQGGRVADGSQEPWVSNKPVELAKN